MPHWVSITIAVACVLYALMQARMYLVYTGRAYSPMIGQVQSATLSAVAMRAIVVYLSYALILLAIPWPKLLTYLAAIWLLAAVVDRALGWYGKGAQGAAGAILHQTEEGRRIFIWAGTFAIAIRALIFVVCAIRFGF